MKNLSLNKGNYDAGYPEQINSDSVECCINNFVDMMKFMK